MDNSIKLVGLVLDHNDDYSFNLLIDDNNKVLIVAYEKLNNMTGNYVYIRGSLRSCKMNTYVLADEVEIVDKTVHVNDVYMEGYVCNKNDKELLVVLPRCSKCDFIKAKGKEIELLNVGDRVRLAGKLKSCNVVVELVESV